MISDRTGADTTVGGRLTPETVRRLDFPRTPLGRRGYHETDVERFRNRVVLEIVTANAEKAELRQEIQRLRDYYRRQGVTTQGGSGRSSGSRRQTGGQTGGQASSRSGEQPVQEPATGGVSVDAVNVMSRAQQAADQHIAQAEEYARRLIGTARTQYEEILVHAHDQAEQAAAEAAEITELQRRRALVATAIDPDQAAHLLHLESRLTYMRTFAQVTQVQLRSILDALGEELDQLAIPPLPG